MVLWDRFASASVVAAGEMSTPQSWRHGMCGERSEWRRSGMQPVPVQRSRMRRVLGALEEGARRRRREARWVVMFSVSVLRRVGTVSQSVSAPA